jgi:DNA-binding MarR family transcriptional regulator
VDSPFDETPSGAAGDGTDPAPGRDRPDAPAGEHISPLDAVGPAFSRLRRGTALAATDPMPRKDMTRTLVLNILSEATERPGPEITVGVVAERLGVDPSVASRMVSDCISAGYIVRVASQQDGRRTILQLTAGGDDKLAQFRRHQRAAFEHITRAWTDEERRTFANLLIRYADALSDLRQP